MELKLTFEDGSEGLAHYGVKGMKWGVRNDETLRKYAGPTGGKRARRKEAKAYQKSLRSLDSDLRTQTHLYSNSLASTEHYVKKARAARNRGKTDEFNKYVELADFYLNKTQTVGADRERTGKKMVDTLLEAQKKGYSVKVTKTEFQYPNSRRYYRDLESRIGKSKGARYTSNAVSGNWITVRPSEQLSDKKKAKWKENHGTMNTYRPQTVTYTYY